MSELLEKPVCVALILCNEVIEDKATNNKTLVGLFNTIGVQSLPAQHPKMSVLVALTNVVGTLPLTVSFRSPEEREILKFEGQIESRDPLAVNDVVLQLNGFPLEETGTHRLDVFVGSEHLVGRRFSVTKLDQPNGRD